MSEFSRLRTISLALAVGLGSSACARSTTEGVATRGCIDGTATFRLAPGNAIYLGDVSSDEAPFNGTRDDWFKVTNDDGEITFDSERGHEKDTSTDDGTVTVTRDGFEYVENDHTYRVAFDDSSLGNDTTIQVAVETTC